MSDTNISNNFSEESNLTPHNNSEINESVDITLNEEITASLSSFHSLLNSVAEASLTHPTISLEKSESKSISKAPIEDLPLDNLESLSQHTDWFALARKLRQHNRELVKTVVQLEQALADSQEALQSQIIRFRSADTLITQQNEELNNTQEQITRLFNELEASHQTAQRQQILIENVTEQLQQCQAQIAQLERECALTQEAYNKQSYQLVEAEKQSRELRSRLHRQQRQTLQFKAALEQCLEVPDSSSLHNASSVVGQIKPIQPWSSTLENLQEVLDLSLEESWHDLESASCLEVDLSTSETIETKVEKTPMIVKETEDFPLENQELDLAVEFIDNTLTDLEKLAEEISPSVSTFTEDSPTESSPSISIPTSPITSIPSNWPSPTIYPWRSQKKRKSMAMVDLPKFNRSQPS